METVIKCEKTKEWNGKPIYTIHLSDGRGGESFASEIPVGTPVSELEITPNGNYPDKIRLKNQQKGGFSGGQRQRSGNESFALSYAKDVVIGGKTDIKHLFALADKMYEWLEKKKSLSAPTAPVILASQLPNKPEDKTDDLPF